MSDSENGVRLRLWGVVRRVPLIPSIAITVFLLLVVTGTTTSSIGVSSMRSDPAHPNGTTIGTPEPTRSDEWLAQTPMDLGVLAVGRLDSTSPLANKPDVVYQLPSGGIAESIVFFDGSALRLGRILSDEWLFAAYWWLPALLLVLALPAWLRRLGVSNNLAWLATGLTLIAPASAWWSLFPVRIMGFAVAGAYLMMLATDRLSARRPVIAGIQIVLATVLLARMPSFYAPWSITLAVPIVVTTVVWLLWERAGRRAALVVCACTAVLSLGLFGVVVIENWPTFISEFQTVYPGTRRATSEAQSPGRLFGAPVLGYLQTKPTVVATNFSETSSSFTFFALWALVLAIAHPARGWGRRRVATLLLGASTCLWLVWSMVDLGSLGRHIPLVNFVEPDRAAQTVGYTAVLVLVLVLSRLNAAVPVRLAVMVGAVCALATAYGGSSLQRNLPTLGATFIVGTSAAVGIVVFLITRFRNRWWPVLIALACASACVVVVNPIQVGLGDLRHTPVADMMMRYGDQARQDESYWATDSLITDGLLIAEGVPMFSGRQITGPIRSEWSKLDPTGKYEQSWNRGSSYLEVIWSQDPTPKITNPGVDQIVLTADPCTLSSRGFVLKHIVSTAQLPNSCLTSMGTFQWGGSQRYMYAVS